MEEKQYDEQDAQIISLFIQNQLSKTNNSNLTGVCNTNTYNLRKGILKYSKKARRPLTKNCRNYTIERY